MKTIIALLTLAAASHGESLDFRGKRFSYLLYKPSPEVGERPAVLLLHGAGGVGRDMLDLWKPFAKSHGIVLIAPDLPRELAFEAIAPAFFKTLVDGINGIDRHRVYVFGYSMGGYLAFDAAMFGSGTFAAVGLYGNFISQEYEGILKEAQRKIPIAIYAGAKDELIPIASVRATRDLLEARGIPLRYREFPAVGHNYGVVAREVNADAWAFFEQVRLP